MSLADITRVVHNLLDEGVPIRDMRTIAETLAIYRGADHDPDTLTTQVRVALGASIFQSVNGTTNELPVMVLDAQLEQMVSNALQNNRGAVSLMRPSVWRVRELVRCCWCPALFGLSCRACFVAG